MLYLPKHLLTIDGTSLCLMYTGPKLENGGELAPLGEVYNTLAYREQAVCTSQSALKQEEGYIRQPLCRCNFSPWALTDSTLRSIIDVALTTLIWQTTDTGTITKMAEQTTKTFPSSASHKGTQ